MAHAYTPGLKVTKRMTHSVVRMLPIKGDVSVKVGDTVTFTVRESDSGYAVENLQKSTAQQSGGVQ